MLERFVIGVVALALLVVPAHAEEPEAAATPAPAGDHAAVVAQTVAFLLERQEGDDRAEWPYEGVYRVRGEIPIGYRVGGTAIVARVLVDAPGWDDDAPRRAAVARATAFIAKSVEHPKMKHAFRGTYDVRGWGYAYGLGYLLHLRAIERVPEGQAEGVDAAIRFFLDGIASTSIPERGGWNYARRGGFDAPGPPSPFMTAPTLQALAAAKRQDFTVDDLLIESGLAALERARSATGSFVYAGSARTRPEPVPGSVGRMLAGEVAMHEAGTSSPERLRGALDAFIVHWSWLEKRRAKDGTHKPPYGVAPYYFWYAHCYAAQAVALLPASDRAEYARRVRDLVFETRDDEGRWNDRVFTRSAAYGSAMALGALLSLEDSSVRTPQRP